MREGKPMNINVTIGSASSATVAKNGDATPEGPLSDEAAPLGAG